MKEIIFIRQSSPEMGGVEWQIIKFAEKLFSRHCFKPVLITSDNQSTFAKDFAACGFEVLAVPMEKIKIFSAIKDILKILENREVAVIQTHLFRESAIGRAIRKKKPGIRHIFRAETYIDCLSRPRWKKNLYHLLDKITSRWVDCYIANGQYLANEIVNRSKVNPNKIIVLLNGTDPIGPPDEPCGRLYEPLSPRIAMIANLKKGKGHDCLIKALAELKKRNLKIAARFIGGKATGSLGNARIDDTEEQIKKMAEELNVSDQIEFYGYTRDIYIALEGILVVVLPSDSEGIPNCIFEAMSLRKLVIASNTGGVDEMIEHGKTGLLHQPKDYKGFADCLEKVFTTPANQWENVRNAGFEKWQKEFTGTKMVNDFIEIYQRLGVL